MPARAFIVKLAFLALLMIGPLWGMLLLKWPTDSDFIIYATLQNAFSSQLWLGDYYPHWLTETNASLGSPHFFIFSPLPYYLGSLLQGICLLDPHGFARTAIGMAIAIFTAGITSYRWFRTHWANTDAESGALLYVGFPYVLVITYVAFGFPQLWAIAWFPLLLEAADNLTNKGWRAIPKLSIGYALLCFTHLPSTVIFSAIPLIYIAVFSARGRRFISVILGLIAAAIGVCLSAVYLLPLIQNQPYIRTDNFVSGRFSYVNNFFSSYSAVGFLLVIFPLIALYYGLPKIHKQQLFNAPVRFWVIMLGALSFMVLPLSRPLWDLLPPLQNLQFPFRFFTGMLPGAVFIAALWLPQNRIKFLYKILFPVILICVSITISKAVFTHEIAAGVKPVIGYNLTPFGKGYMQTKWLPSEDAVTKTDYMYSLPRLYQAMPYARLSEGKGSISLLTQTPRTIKLSADIDSANALAVIKQFYFPGWHITPETIKIEPNKEGLLSFQLPRGKHEIILHAAWKGEREGTIISLVALLLVAMIAMAAKGGRTNAISPTV